MPTALSTTIVCTSVAPAAAGIESRHARRIARSPLETTETVTSGASSTERGYVELTRGPTPERSGTCWNTGVDDCLFCKIAAGELPATRVHEDDRVIAIMDIFPATRGHALVIPRAHAGDVRDVEADDLAAAARAAQRLA